MAGSAAVCVCALGTRRSRFNGGRGSHRKCLDISPKWMGGHTHTLKLRSVSKNK